MSVLQVFMFGKFQVKWREELLSCLDARKVQELFCYLLLFRDRSHHRETLADLLWGGNSTVQSRSYLRKALWQLQTGLDAQAEFGSNWLLRVESDWVQTNPEADLWLDVAMFEQVYNRVQGIPGRDLDYESAETLKKAVLLYRGDLLEGWYEDWCIYERERLKHIYLSMLDKLIKYCEGCHEYETGINFAHRVLHHDHARERTHRRLMRLQFLAGYRTEALRQYLRCASALDDELGVKPSERTVALYEQIKIDQLDGSSQIAADVSQATSPPWPELLDRLKHLEVTLSEVQHLLTQNIQKGERDING
jgi:DNA-binding SARP family transcriptional activator